MEEIIKRYLNYNHEKENQKVNFKKIHKKEEVDLMKSKKGFLTVATGKEHYYQIAANLLESYRYCTPEDERLPFAILCDKENEYTKKFDKVIIIDNPNFSYLDKIEMLRLAPFEQNIFIDADCLVYNPINYLFDKFNGLTGVRFIGDTLPLNTKNGWFLYDDIGEYKNSISFIPNFHGGMFYFSNDEMTKRVYNMALEINRDYYKYKFHLFEKPADEPIFALCISVLNLKPVYPDEETKRSLVFAPSYKKIRCNILKHKLQIISDNKKSIDYNILHWQNLNTFLPLYKREVGFLYNRKCRINIILIEIKFISKQMQLNLKNSLKNNKERLSVYITNHQKVRKLLRKIKSCLGGN